MCFFSLHNECPPVNYTSAQVPEVISGIVTGEVATSSMLRAMGDCLEAMACVVDTGGGTMAAWGKLVESSSEMDPAALVAQADEVRANLERSFDAVEATEERITLAIQKYRELQEYGQRALTDGRGDNYEAAFGRLGTGGFAPMVERRIEGLRRLKVRVQLYTNLRAHGLELLENNDYAGFFLWFMQPIRDLSVAVNELYSEALQGALASNRAMFQSCRLVGEELPVDMPAQYAQTPA
jgi:hypothetical protein